MKYIWLKDGKPWKETSDIKGERATKEYFEGGVERKFIYYGEGSVGMEVWKEVWYKDGVLHRDGDKPAVITYN